MRVNVDYTGPSWSDTRSRFTGYVDFTPDVKNNRVNVNFNVLETFVGPSELSYSGFIVFNLYYLIDKVNPDDSDSHQGSSSAYTTKSIYQDFSGDAYVGKTWTHTGSVTLIPFKDGGLHSTGTIEITIYGFNSCYLNVQPGEISYISNGHNKVNNNWKKSFAWKKIDGNWKRGLLWKKISGVWNKGK